MCYCDYAGDTVPHFNSSTYNGAVALGIWVMTSKKYNQIQPRFTDPSLYLLTP